MSIKEGEFLSLLGPSGCGKTTILRMIAGFDEPSSGELLIDGSSALGKAPDKRPINTVFQSYALFPHMTIKENVAYGLRRKRWAKSRIPQAVQDSLDMVNMGAYADRYPAQLSGGQQQRIALARAVVNEPRVLLLDEPLGALDLKLRKQMQLELMRIHRQVGTTFIYVTHDQEEALVMSDRIAVLNGGIVEQLGSPRSLYDSPRSRFVADFMGSSNIFEIDSGDSKAKTVSVGGVDISVQNTEALESGTDNCAVIIRPERISVTTGAKADADNCVRGRIVESAFLGPMILILAEVPFGTLNVKIPYYGQDTDFEQGEELYFSWQASDAIVIK
ncbi:ABC transporter ATP-binding protein [Brevibacterium spongiae]|uniref:Spermidine/putrescine import ATP-binding protein PotA n=1 Tax=Brevibacterium spongiae TaxID=2909672 RepID=A0ABY5SRT4_9MICO|nr:ABC transporter ATP-binding protein [Brevibacterium spongiae]UVI36626.1 ABC transporter ATP-binding protein [Brevibacterium spongiae]